MEAKDKIEALEYALKHYTKDHNSHFNGICYHVHIWTMHIRDFDSSEKDDFLQELHIVAVKYFNGDKKRHTYWWKVWDTNIRIEFLNHCIKDLKEYGKLRY